MNYDSMVEYKACQDIVYSFAFESSNVYYNGLLYILLYFAYTHMFHWYYLLIGWTVISEDKQGAAVI